MEKIKVQLFLILITAMLCCCQMKVEPKGMKIASEKREREKASKELTVFGKKYKSSAKETFSKREKDDAVWGAKEKAYKEILLKFTAAKDAALGNLPGGSFLGMLQTVITATAKAQKGSLWDQLRNQVDSQIEKKLAGYHYSNVQSHFHELDAALELTWVDSEREHKSYAIRVMGKKNFMLPQQYDDIGYSDKLATMLPTWAIYALPAILQLAKRGQVDDCYVSTKLAQLRRDTIAAGRSLLLKRYKALVPITSEEYKSVTFRDPFTERDIVSNVRLDNICDACNEVKELTVASIKTKLVDVINNFFNSTFCFECDCPEPIEMSEIAFDYSHTCFGVGKSSQNDGKCSLPCAKWGGSKSYWCLEKIETMNSNHLMGGQRGYKNTWDYCEPTAIDVCSV